MVRNPAAFILASCWLMTLVSLDGGASDQGKLGWEGKEGKKRKRKEKVHVSRDSRKS